MKIDDAMNLVIPVTDSVTAYHTPISRAVYEANYDLLNSTKATISEKGLQYLRSSGPLVAALTLKDEGLRDADSRGKFDAKGNPADDRAPALLSELKRLTTVLVPGAAGYEVMPIDAAVSSGKLDAEDAAELESAIVFFTSYVLSTRKAARTATAQAMASMLGGSITSSAPTEYAASLPTLTKVAPTPNQASSLPV